MVSSIQVLGNVSQTKNVSVAATRSATQDSAKGISTDKVELGKSGPLSTAESIKIVTERAMEKLRAVVQQARDDLGLASGDTLDTSPEATAGRIADFALGFFSKYAENNKLSNDEAGRKQFADFIGGAIQKGIEEARGILTALNSLSGDVDGNINKTWEVIQQRLDGFVKNGSSTPANAV